MIALISAYKNLIAIGLLVALGGAIVTGIYTAGARAERNKVTAETMAVNTAIVSVRGKDEAEIAAEAAASAKADAVVAGAISQVCLVTEETARLIGAVK